MFSSPLVTPDFVRISCSYFCSSCPVNWMVMKSAGTVDNLARKGVFNKRRNNAVGINNEFHANRLRISALILCAIRSASCSVNMLFSKIVSTSSTSCSLRSNAFRAISVHFKSGCLRIRSCSLSETDNVIFPIFMCDMWEFIKVVAKNCGWRSSKRAGGVRLMEIKK